MPPDIPEGHGRQRQAALATALDAFVRGVVVVEQFGELEYRRGRLLLPRDIAEWAPARIARWLSGVPVGERSRAFRALPLNVAAAGFLAMEPRFRVGLLAGLNPANISYLSGISRDEDLLETLLTARDDVRLAIMESLPEWRRGRLEAMLAERAQAEVADGGSGQVMRSGARRSWTRRLIASLQKGGSAPKPG